MNDVSPATRVDRDPSTAEAAGAHYDVLIVGAGLSGVGAACHLVQKRPGTTFAILEARGAIGGTWDLFRYPGVRSDSDMSTFGYAFRPVGRHEGDRRRARRSCAIWRETAEEYGVDRPHPFRLHRVDAGFVAVGATRAGRSRSTAQTARSSGSHATFSSCAPGITNTRQGYMPGWPGDGANSPDRIVHPQKWPEDLRYDGKRVVVIGSGATAVTLVPALAERAAHVVDAATVADLCRRPPVRGGDREPA